MAMMAIEPLLAAAGGEAAAGGAAAGGEAAGGGAFSGLAGKFGGQALISKAVGGGHHQVEEKQQKPSLVHSLMNGNPLVDHVANNYGSILQGGQFG